MVEKPEIKLYRVRMIVPRTIISDTGETVEMREVHFTTVTEVEDSILVPKDMGDKEVISEVKKAAKVIEAIIKAKE